MRIKTTVTLAALAATIVSPATAQQRREEVMFERDFQVGAGGRLRVEVGDMDLDVRPGDVSSVHVRVIARARDMSYARERFEDQRFEAEAAGREVHLRTRERSYDGDWREWRRRGGVSFRAEVTVPREFDVELHTGDGDIRLGDLTGDASLDTGDGDVWIEGITGSRVSLQTGDGDVTVRRLAADEIELRTGDGDLTLERVSGAITASTGDGDVELDIERFAGASIHTGDGDVRIYADASIRADVDIEGEDLEVSRPFTVSGRLDRHHLSGSLNGGGPRLSVRTGDGSVSLRTR